MSTENPAKPSPPKQPGLLRRTLSRHWLSFLAVWLATTMLAWGLVWILVKPAYKAYSVLRVEPFTTVLFGNETLDSFLETQIQLITSPNVLTAAGTNPRVANLERIKKSADVVLELKKLVSAHVALGTTLIEVSAITADSHESAVIVNAVVDSYLALNEEWANSMTQNQIKSLETYLRDLESQTDELERQWKEIVAKDDTGDELVKNEKQARQNPNEAVGTSATLDEYKRVKSQIRDLELELAETRAVFVTAQAAALRTTQWNTPVDDKAQSDKVMHRRFQTDPEVMDLAEKMRSAQDSMGQKKRLVTNGRDPAILVAQHKIDSLKAKYDSLWETKSSAWLEKAELVGVPGAMSPQQEIRDLENKIERLEAKSVALKKFADELDINHKKNATDSVKIMLIRDQRESLKNMQEAVQRRLEQLQYESRTESRVRKVSEATPSFKPVSDSRPIFLTIAPFVLLFAAFGFFLAVEATTGSKIRSTVADGSKPEQTPEI